MVFMRRGYGQVAMAPRLVEHELESAVDCFIISHRFSAEASYDVAKCEIEVTLFADGVDLEWITSTYGISHTMSST